MKTLRMIGMVVMTILMSVGFMSCSSDDDEVVESGSIVGSWTGAFASDFGDTSDFEFTSNGSVSEVIYDKSVKTYEEQGTYVFANGKLTINLVRYKKLQEDGQWTEWIDRVYNATFDASVKGDKLTLSNSKVNYVLSRKK